MDVIQIVLLALVTFILAIDQFSLTEVLYRPMVACPIIGLVLGDVETGLVVGGTYELMMVGNMPVGGAQPPNVVLGSIVAMIFAVRSGMTVDAALGTAVIFSLFGQYAVTLTFTIMSGLMAKADKAAADANPKGISQVNIISCLILGSLFALMAIIAYVGGNAMTPVLKKISEDFSWLMAGLGAAGGMMRNVGFAVLLKIMMSNEFWGIYLAGFAIDAIFVNIGATSSSALILVAFIGVAIAIYDFTMSLRIKQFAGSGNGGMSDGI